MCDSKKYGANVKKSSGLEILQSSQISIDLWTITHMLIDTISYAVQSVFHIVSGELFCILPSSSDVQLRKSYYIFP